MFKSMNLPNLSTMGGMSEKIHFLGSTSGLNSYSSFMHTGCFSKAEDWILVYY